MSAFICSNPNCRAIHQADPQGPCPRCMQADGSGWSTMERQFPRRNNIDCDTPAEAAIREALRAVEALGCHELLTQASCMLIEAREKVADYIDGRNA